MVCANPDLAVIRGDRMIPCAGALAALYAEMGGSVAYYGKPDRAIFDASIARLGCERSQVLMIGDGLKTDIKGAAAADIDALLIAGGINQDLLVMPDGTLDPQRISAAAAQEGGGPQFVMKALIW
jgi:ribonucleotide monophosphatase NagD (HAD superfamily)